MEVHNEAKFFDRVMLFDSTVRQELARTFGATLIVLLTIVLTVFLIKTIGEAAGGVVAPQDVVLVLGYVSLGHLPTLLSLSLFVAVVVTLSRMYRDSEMVIWFASGVGLSRFVRPVLRTSWPVLVVIGLCLAFVWPWVNRAGNDLRERYVQRSDLLRVTPGVFQTSRDGSRVFFVERDDEAQNVARNVFVLTQRGGRESVTTAAAGRIEVEGERRYLVLEHGQRNESDAARGEKALASFEHFRVLVSERAVRRAEDRSPRELYLPTLLTDPQPRRQGELAWRLGMLLGTGNLLLIAIGLAATNPRRASSWNLLFALLAFVVYFNLITLTKAWVAGGRIGTGAALGVHVLVFAFALALLWWREHAEVTRRSAGRRRVAATT
jgi:lipopolysaccharide export system permease protein